MAARKRAAKKAVEPVQEPQVTGEAQDVVTFDEGAAETTPDEVEPAPEEPKVLAASTFPVPRDDFIGPKTMSRKIHDNQNAVRRLQERFGHTSNGIWNRPLADAVIEFQRENGLTVTGLVDRETWDALLAE